MFNYTPNPAGPLNPVMPLLDVTDLALGGSGGNMNAATQKLADNDAYLYAISGGFENLVQLTNSGGPVNITTANLYRNLVVMYQSVDAYFTGTMPDCSTYRTGAKATIRRLPLYGSTSKPVTLTAFFGQYFIDKYVNTPQSIYLHDGECVTLYNTGSAWVILSFEGNYYTAGDQSFGYSVKPGTILRNGSLYNRADYPRLWAWINAQLTAASGLVVPDIMWNSATAVNGIVNPYFSKFSTGDGSTTFRVPNDLGVFDRGLGGGRDADRIAALTQNIPGDLQPDGFASHSHTINQTPHSHGIYDPTHGHNIQADHMQKGGTSNDVWVVDIGDDSIVSPSPQDFSGKILGSPTNITINNATVPISNQNTGGTESRPVNAGKWPLLVY